MPIPIFTHTPSTLIIHEFEVNTQQLDSVAELVIALYQNRSDEKTTLQNIIR
jgi:hypothetical protein